MPINSPEDYAQAQEYASSGKASPKLLASMKAYEAQRDSDPHMSQQTSEQSLESAQGVPVARPAPEVPKAGADGFWKPERPLGVMDYVAQDGGGKLAIWREMPIEVYRKKVLGPQRQAAIAAGEQARMDFQRFGANAFSPQDQMARTVAIARGAAAAAQDPEAIDENDPGYKQFNDQQWQQAVQQRQQDPNAGPIQRMERLKDEGLAGQIAYTIERGKDKALSAARGALDMGTLGLGTGAIDALNEAVAGREAVDVGRGIEEANPWSHAAGSAGMMLARPTLGTGGLMSAVYGKALPAIGKYGAAALSGAVSGAAEGLGKDVSAETADALSDDPNAAMERGRLDPARLGVNTAMRAGLSGAGGVLGQGITDAGGAIATKLDMNAVKNAGRPIFSWLERRGYRFGPLRGEISPPEAKAQLKLSAEDPMGRPVAQRISKNAGGPINDNVLAEADALQGRQAQELEGYFRSVGASNKLVPITHTDDAIAKWLSENSTAMEITKPVEKLYSNLMERVNWQPETGGIRPREMHAFMQQLSEAAKADNQLAGAYKAAQRGMMMDIEKAPRVAGGPDWSNLRSHHNFETVRMNRARQDTGVRDNPEWDLADRYQQAPVRKAIETIGSPGARVETEQALKRFAPPEVRHELETLEAMNAARAHVNGPWTGLASDSGTLKFLSGAGKPRLYGLGRMVSADAENVAGIGPTVPISDKLFTFLNARVPRATMFVPGMDLNKMVQERLEMDGRPKTFKDLTPEQQQMLMQLVSPEQEAHP